MNKPGHAMKPGSQKGHLYFAWFYRRAASLSVILLSLLINVAPVSAQVNDPAYRDYFLVGQFGEVCTMCEVIVRCDAGDEPESSDGQPLDRGTFTLYHLQTRTFWSQISTIWEWFIANFSTAAADGHSRPVHVYQVTDGQFSDMQLDEAHLSLVNALISLRDAKIDRQSRRWQRDDGMTGYCRRLPLWDSLAVIEQETAP